MATKKAVSTKKKAATKKTPTSSKVTKTTVKTAPATAKKQSVGQHVDGALRSPQLWRALAAEFIGTFLFAAAVIAGQGSPLVILFAVAGVVLLISSVSGAHINPAVTVGAWATRRIGWLRAIGYILVQFLGAAVAFFTLRAFLGAATQPSAEEALYTQAATLFSAADLVNITGKEWYAFAAEALGTAILGFAVANALRFKSSLSRSFSVGFGLFIAVMIVTTGGFIAATTVLNPAVALTLQAYAFGGWSYAIYALAPVIGAVFGFIIFDLIYGKKKNA